MLFACTADGNVNLEHSGTVYFLKLVKQLLNTCTIYELYILTVAVSRSFALKVVDFDNV